MTQRRAATTRLEPGEHSIDRNTPTQRRRNGQMVWVLDWSVRLHDSRLIKDKRTQGSTPTEVKRKAKKQAAELLKRGGASRWKGSDSMTRYLEEVAAKEIDGSGKAPASIRQYKRALKQLTRELSGHSTNSAMHYDVLVAALDRIAATNGAESARQARTVLGKYVSQPMRRHRLIDRNPLEGAHLDLKRHAPASDKPKRGGQALRPAEQERAVSWLLKLDPAKGVERPKRGRWSLEHRVQKRRSAVLLTLLQAGTGLRIGEALALQCWMLAPGEDKVLRIVMNGAMTKTTIGRGVPVMDPRIEARIMQRLSEAESPEEYLIPAPASPLKQWSAPGNGGATQQVAELYKQMAVELDVPLMQHARSHLWRTTLRSRLLEAGVDSEDAAAILGHDESTAERSYTDRTDTTALVAAYRRLHTL
jgi:integrase